MSKMSIAEEEADETIYWMELSVEAKFVLPERVDALIKECEEILAITISSIKTCRKGNYQA
ncbi:MAG: four helix bundle protein [Chitinivibrionales bacterium]|nr:four helix bundle protein [Chitinivibrionales bacterium]